MILTLNHIISYKMMQNENEAYNAIVVYKYSQNKASNDYEKNDNNIVKDIVHIEIDEDVDLVEET